MKVMKKVVSVLLTLAMVVGLFMGTSTTSEAASVRFQRNVYYAFTNDVAKSITASDVKTYKISHIDYAFLKVTAGGYIVSGSATSPKSGSYLNIDSKTSEALTKLVALKKSNSKLKIMVSLFGGDDSQAAIVRANIKSSDFRRHVGKAVAELIKTYGIDGVDLDWESPSSEDGGKEVAAYLQLCQEIRNRAGAKGKGTLLTIATSISSNLAKTYKPYVSEFNKVLDFWNLMTYDLTSSSHVGFVSPMVTKSGSTEYGFSSFKDGIKMYHDAGVSYSDMNVGIPFYGRGFKLNSSTSTLTWYASATKDGEYTYGTLVDSYINKNGWTRAWESNAQCYYLYKKNSSGKITNVITYDDPTSIGYKLKYAQSLGISGVMTWQYGGDDSSNTLKKRVAEFVRSEVVN